jgi:acetylglutamate kinase
VTAASHPGAPKPTTRVIKVGGRPQSDPCLVALLASAFHSCAVNGQGVPARLVLVHGGGDEVSALQQALGGSTTFVDGRRVTTERDIELIRMALSGSANKRLVSALVGAGVPAVGVSGEDAALLVATPLDRATLGLVGAPSEVRVDLIEHLLDGGYLPVLSPVSRDASEGAVPGALNVNGDDAAAALAVALGADELLLVSDVEGVARDGELFAKLTPSCAESLVRQNVASGGMRAKLEAGCNALAGGVARVRISDVGAIADPGRGTLLTNSGELS